ncbi:UDP-glucose 4-epimerase isoform X2 [Onychostruthus taczanowskii]|uniref:UDP-glucose 4-epimerase isoform X2 n=1 Tax=Onychostruthus taczanowskii TaxID=356909 RepID=UPI001B80491A|nr:UDP-glucose 4-epimerase isoform X2 [Onychostruthus taczanowskii]
MAETILVTGGAGYIGSHCVLELLQAGYVPVVIDNFHNAIRGSEALPESLRRVQEIAHRPVIFQELDITDEAALQELFRKHRFSAVMHFAGLKAVGESVQKPLEYYRVNLTGTIRLLETMKAHGVRNIVFSSSATVYGDPKYLPLDEKHPVGGCTNPYGKSKFFIEEMIWDLCRAERDWNAVLLRYFNPIGAHESGMIGEDPQGIPNNLMPYVAQVEPPQPLGVTGRGRRRWGSTGLSLCAGGSGTPRVPERLWERLQDGRWNGSQGLHPRRGPGQGPHRCSEEAQGELWLQDLQPGHRHRLLRAADGPGHGESLGEGGKGRAAGSQAQGSTAPTGPCSPPAALAPFPQPPPEPPSPRCCSPCRSSTGSRPGGRGTWPPATLTPRWPSGSWAGKLPLAWTRCVRTCGGGSCRTPRASARTELCRGLAGPKAALSQLCLLPRGLSPSWEGTSSSPSCLWHGAGRLEHPQPLPSSSSSPRSFHLTEQNHKEQRTEPGPGLAPRAWNAPGLQPARAGSS